jgi:hypothetical protein
MVSSKPHKQSSGLGLKLTAAAALGALGLGAGVALAYSLAQRKAARCDSRPHGIVDRPPIGHLSPAAGGVPTGAG